MPITSFTTHPPLRARGTLTSALDGFRRRFETSRVDPENACYQRAAPPPISAASSASVSSPRSCPILLAQQLRLAPSCSPPELLRPSPGEPGEHALNGQARIKERWLDAREFGGP